VNAAWLNLRLLLELPLQEQSILTVGARAEGIEKGAIQQVALLAIGPLGLPRAVAAKTWIEDKKR
jgi:hypothetical protein